jgi:hypothetical protein
LYFVLSLLYKEAIEPSKGESGLGSVSKEDIDNNTFPIFKAGLQFDFNISRHIVPLEVVTFG